MSKKKAEAYVLVGFGDENLVDVVGEIGTDPEMDEYIMCLPVQSIPRYRREGSCSLSEIEAFVKYTTWLANLVTEYDQKDE